MPASATEREARVRAAFADQAGWCERLGSPFTARLCRLVGERLDRGTELGRRVLGWEGDPSPGGDVLPLRLAGGLHALVRRGAIPALAACYPPATTPDDEALWHALGPVLGRPDLLPWLDSAPQTNEVGRSAVLMSGLLVIAERTGKAIELFELGASAGLNLNLDLYAHDLGGVAAGDPRSPVRLSPEWEGPPPPRAGVRIAGRRGVDLAPLDPGRDGETLLAYVWPDQIERLARLEGALHLAREHRVAVEAGDAAAWTEERLAAPQPEGVARVLLHSLAFQYFPQETRRRVTDAAEAAGLRATPGRPFAWLRYEKCGEDEAYSLRLRTWPGGEDGRLAWVHPHGSRISWASPAR